VQHVLHLLCIRCLLAHTLLRARSARTAANRTRGDVYSVHPHVRNTRNAISDSYARLSHGQESLSVAVVAAAAREADVVASSFLPAVSPLAEYHRQIHTALISIWWDSRWSYRRPRRWKYWECRSNTWCWRRGVLFWSWSVSRVHRISRLREHELARGSVHVDIINPVPFTSGGSLTGGRCSSGMPATVPVLP